MSELLVNKVTFGSNGSQVSPGLTGFRNKIINGNFDIWQRNTTQTTSGYGSDDRWRNENSGSTKVHSQQTFALGQTDVPGNPKYFSRTVVTSVAGATNFVTKAQRIEYVETLAGKTATLSFWAKADSTKNLGYDIYQMFGTGGSPSGNVTASIGNIALTSNWTRYTITFNVPSVSGKTKGSDGNDSFIVRFWFDAGSSYTGGSLTVGQQSGTFDIAQVQLEEGSEATEFEQRPLTTEIQLCQRYFEKSYTLNTPQGTVTQVGMVTTASMNTSDFYNLGFTKFQTVKRSISPVIVPYSPFDGSLGVLYNIALNTNQGNSGVTGTSDNSFRVNCSNSAMTAANAFGYHYTADAEL